MSEIWKNKLYFGDNLDILKEYIPDESVDLIYLDPPFNSNANYNVLFKESSGEQSSAQIKAFDDTWSWGLEADLEYDDLVMKTAPSFAGMIESLRRFLGQSDMMAYLVMMASRLLELHRVLKRTGSLYLHCDSTASHYLKIMMDQIFGAKSFRNEIIWKRSATHGDAHRFGPVHDVLLFYSKSDTYTWNTLYQPYDPTYVAKHYRRTDPDGRRWQDDNLTAPGIRNGESGKSWHGIDVASKGIHWKFTINTLEDMDKKGKIHWTSNGLPRYKRYLDEQPGVPIQDVWTDIKPINSQAQERLGYPTQKPEALLERILRASSNEGDLVLDPFCGCGTALAVAERLHRRWIGIDITHLAISLMRHRLHDAYGRELAPYEVLGDPKDVASAQSLALEDRYQFQWWALGLLDARPAKDDRKKGADAGIDGVIRFFEDPESKATRQIIIQVKSGHVNASMIRDLKGVVEREAAAIGVFVTLEPATRNMLNEASSAGFYRPELLGGRYPKIQILTIEDLLNGKAIDYPRYGIGTFKKARLTSKAGGTVQADLFGSRDGTV